VLALPRGGVPVAYEVARTLGATLDLLVARKLGAPHQPEFGIGAVAWDETGGVRFLHPWASEVPGVTAGYVEEVSARELAEAERLARSLQGARPAPDLAEKVVILVDDGLATGATARAAILAARRRSPRRLVLAAPVCAPNTAGAIRPEVDDLTCLLVPRNLTAVGLYYKDFEQVGEEEVITLLARARSSP
jgi:predicted phosphoribosyltransferase